MADRRSMEWLKAWIKDNNALRASGDQDAIDIFNEYNGMPMTAFPQLSDEDIDAIIAYTTAGDVQQVAAAAEGEVLATPKSSSAWMSYIVVFVLLVLIVWIFVASNNGFLKIAATIFVLILTGYILFDTLWILVSIRNTNPFSPLLFHIKYTLVTIK